MRLEKLTLQNFKNYREVEVVFGSAIHCLLGKNGSGKTNLLDAIHYLSFTKSAVNPSDSQNILTGEKHFIIRGEFRKGEKRHQIVCSYQENQKKIIREDELDTPKLASHIGKYPVVLVAPNDIELIWDGSELRRKFIDSLISQTDPAYLEHLMLYAHYLKQRNGLLRIFSEQGRTDKEMLETYDQKLIPSAEYIFNKRKAFMEKFIPVFLSHYKFMAGDSTETVGIAYRSQFDEATFGSLLKQHLVRDLALQRTTTGIHRDDLVFTLNNGELKRIGSQGQQKSFLIALKLTEFEVLTENKKFKPLLLLDDIFDKLDDSRIQKLMLLVANGTFGQLFITDARSARSKQILKDAGVKGEVVEIEEGRII